MSGKQPPDLKIISSHAALKNFMRAAALQKLSAV
jgi:hypothetical protein